VPMHPNRCAYDNDNYNDNDNDNDRGTLPIGSAMFSRQL
jgi:hypothetical protein